MPCPRRMMGYIAGGGASLVHYFSPWLRALGLGSLRWNCTSILISSLTATRRTRRMSWFECCSPTAAAELAHIAIIPMFILFSSTSLPACVGCCSPICSPHLSRVSFHTIFPCRALCTRCGSPQRMKDVCFICLLHAKEDSVFLLKNTVLKRCRSGLPTSMKRLGLLCWCSWVLTLLLVFGVFSLLLYVALSWSFWN